MRRQRNIFDTFPETVDLNQGPTYNGIDMDESDELNKSQGFSSWELGESSSSRANVQDQVANNRPSSFVTHDSRFKDRQYDHQIPVGPLDVDLNIEYGGNSGNDSADKEASSSGTSDERGTGGLFRNGGVSSPMVNPLSVPGVPERSQRYYEQMSTNSSHRSNQQPPLMQVPGLPRNLLPFPWVGTGNPRNGSSSSSGFSRESRNLVQDPTNWSLATGRLNTNGGNPQSSSRNDTIWMPNLNSATNDQQRITDYPPWNLFPSSETESGGHRGLFRPFTAGPSSTSEENGGNSQARHHQPFLRSLDVPDDEWQAFFTADNGGRHRMVSEMRQILNQLRRGENLRAEDYMLFDPFINGVADLHDRHRDMRLDVDNMSYEELLALEERIGDVKTGLTEDVILKSMKQRKHFSFMAISPQTFEPCCICREEYDNGDDVGTLDCGHDFHTCCIKKWLTEKNLCPICKMTGLST